MPEFIATTFATIPYKNFTVVGVIIGRYMIDEVLESAIAKAKQMGADALVDVKVKAIPTSATYCLLSCTAVKTFTGDLVEY